MKCKPDGGQPPQGEGNPPGGCILTVSAFLGGSPDNQALLEVTKDTS